METLTKRVGQTDLFRIINSLQLTKKAIENTLLIFNKAVNAQALEILPYNHINTMYKSDMVGNRVYSMGRDT